MQVCCWLDWPALLAARTTCSRLRQGVEHTAAWTHRRLVICNKVRSRFWDCWYDDLMIVVMRLLLIMFLLLRF